MTNEEIDKEFDEKFCGYMADGRLHFIKPDMDGTAIKDFLKAKINKVIDEMIRELAEGSGAKLNDAGFSLNDTIKIAGVTYDLLKEYKEKFNKLST